MNIITIEVLGLFYNTEVWPNIAKVSLDYGQKIKRIQKVFEYKVFRMVIFGRY